MSASTLKGEVVKSLSERKHNLLIQAIEDYIKDASPITSGSAKEKYIKDISTATLRNELNSLEQKTAKRKQKLIIQN